MHEEQMTAMRAGDEVTLVIDGAANIRMTVDGARQLLGVLTRLVGEE